ncbi:LysR family transcriptional regulator [Pelagibius marinus]|uniref:LysR family transcriptional regulator n=1 Tax=Pelagibius marinus TaxID=2762760 RepID=UPI001872CDCE|nr:LysR family transcriptional regulator [Pelagibius marinus]
MDLRTFECIIMLVEEEHFGRAAERLCISQSALSQRIAKAEAELGSRLFDRTSGAVRATAIACDLARRARDIVNQARAAVAEAKDAVRRRQRRVRIGYTQVVLNSNMPAILRRIQSSLPQVGVEVEEIPSPTQERALANGRLDIGFLHPPLCEPSLAFHDLEPIPMVLAVQSGWPIAARQELTLGDLKDLPFLIAPRSIGPSLHDGILSAFRRAGVDPKIVSEVSPMTSMLGLISAGIGAGLVAQSMVRTAPANVVFIPVAEKLPELPVAIAWHKGEVRPEVQSVIAIFREV